MVSVSGSNHTLAMEKRDTSTICLFDVDGTLTPSRKVISKEMESLLEKLKSKILVALVGGSDLVKIEEQMGGGSNVKDKFDYVFSENGLVAFKKGQEISNRDILEEKGEELLQKVINFAIGYMSKLELPAKRGTFVEFRRSMINLCPVGRSCSQAERDAFSEFDKKNNIRQKFKDALYENFPDAGLKFAIGGQISIDVFPVGWDKTYCLQFIEKDDIKTVHFFGDKTDEGGNDHEIYSHSRTIGHKVSGPDDTMKQVTELFLKD